MLTVDDAIRLLRTGAGDVDCKVELIEGRFIATGRKTDRHQTLQNRLTRALGRTVDRHLAVGITPTLQLDDMAYVEPDIVIYRYSEAPRLTADRAMLVIEIADSSLGFDLGPKAALMARAGVADYWVINAQGLEVTVHREPRADGYGSIRRLSKTEAIDPLHPDLAGLTLCLADLG